MATSLPARCSRLMYSILSSGLASAMKSSTPACSAMYFAVSGLSPVTITVFTPILRRRSKRSRIPVLMMSCNSITPLICSFSETTSGVPPFSEIVRTIFSTSGEKPLPAFRTIARIASEAPLRMRVPSGMSTPEHLVSAVNFTMCTPTKSVWLNRKPCSRPSSTMDLPSGVSSAAEEGRRVGENPWGSLH